MSDLRADLPVVVIGAGPVGLAAAAHLAAKRQGVLLLEAGTSVGAFVRAWGHVQVFSPWRFNVDPAARNLLASSGWIEPDVDVLPTGAEIVAQYLEPLAKCAEIAPHLRLGTRVVIDPNLHSCGTVPPHGADELRHPEPGLFVVGMKSYGRAPTFLMLTGYGQVRSVVAELTGDLAGARRVELTLPATGVCSATPSSSEDAAGCCASTPTPTPVGGLGRKAPR